MHLQKT